MDGGFSTPVAIGFLAVYALLMNAWAFVLFALDKRRARAGGWRIPEQTLLGIAMIGGSLGAVAGQRLLRHKTRKQPFRMQLLFILMVQAAAVGVLAFSPEARVALTQIAATLAG